MAASPAVTDPAPGGGHTLAGAVGSAEAIEGDPPRRRRKIILLLLLFLGFVVLLGLAVWYLLFRQPLPLPTLPGGVVLPTYTTSVYGVDRPMGVAVTADGSRIYVGETTGDRVARVFEPGGQQLALMQPPVSTGTDHSPVYLAVNPLTSEVYVTDRPTGSIYIYDANGTYQRAFDPGATLDGWQPLGIAFDAAGRMYVTDVGASPQSIVVFDSSGAILRKLGAKAGLNFPNGIAADAAGNVYVADSNNGRLIVFDSSDNVIAQVGRGVGEGNLGLPRGVAIDEKGRVYVGDATGQAVFVYSVAKAGDNRLEFLGQLGSQGATDGTFQYPNGVAVDARGRLYVTDSGNDRVQLWSY